MKRACVRACVCHTKLSKRRLTLITRARVTGASCGEPVRDRRYVIHDGSELQRAWRQQRACYSSSSLHTKLPRPARLASDHAYPQRVGCVRRPRKCRALLKQTHHVRCSERTEAVRRNGAIRAPTHPRKDAHLLPLRHVGSNALKVRHQLLHLLGKGACGRGNGWLDIANCTPTNALRTLTACLCLPD